MFGAALDRYAANFWPTPEGLGIIAIMLIGAATYMIADTEVTMHATFIKRLSVRASFLTSLGLAVALDFKGLFF